MATQQVNERLAALTAAGTSIWLDQIGRQIIESGELRRLVEEDSLRGVTSNPTIFNQAILGAPDYDDQLGECARAGKSTREIFQEMAIKDIQDGCDVLRSVYDETNGYDGYVSFEVDPDLAFDTEKTMEQAREYWQRVDRPNLLIKIPGTDAGVPAIEETIAAGINVNITLLFSVESYTAIAEAYIRGMERRLDAGESMDVQSVASFFVSRVREAGAPVQRPLWASTGVKDPRYPETKYVDTLVAPHTVNTMPMPTLRACEDDLDVVGPTADQDPSDDLRALADAGIDMREVTDKL